jgi:hypothetical protein
LKDLEQIIASNSSPRRESKNRRSTSKSIVRWRWDKIERQCLRRGAHAKAGVSQSACHRHPYSHMGELLALVAAIAVPSMDIF